MKSVYCDESGFSGDNLWHPDQPNFAYAAVTMPEKDAESLVESTRKQFRIQNPELHAAQLLKRDNGKRAVMSIVEALVPCSSVVVFHKRYSLAGKMFEYLIEPAISRGNSMFYDLGFHKFVANGLYLALLAGPKATAQTFLDFQETMRTGDVAKLDALTTSLGQDGLTSFLGQIAAFVTCNRREIDEEISASESSKDVPRWMLELTSTALMSLLATLSGEDMTPLSVTCDSSKPLLSQADMFEAMVDRTDFHSMNFDGRTNQITFNLAHKIRFGDSKYIPGLQLADLVAGAAAFALKRRDEEFTRFWLEKCAQTVHRNSVLPEIDEFDIRTERALVNAFVLQELVERSVSGRDLVHGMPQFIRSARGLAPQFLLEQNIQPATA